MHETFAEITSDNVWAVVEGLLSSPRNTIEILLAEGDSALYKNILANFPIDVTNFLPSVARKLSERLSRTLWYHAHSFPPDIRVPLDEHRKASEIGIQILQILVMMSFDKPQTPSLVDEEEEEEEDLTMFNVKVKGKSQKQKKRSKQQNRRAERATVDLKPFQILNEPVPTCQADADSLAISIMDDQWHSLKFFMTAFRYPEVIESLLHQPQAAEITPAKPNDVQDTSKEVEIVSVPDLPAAYPMVQPMKAALYFESVTGFGEWRILVSSRADRNLREARRNDANRFKIIVKKIKELSNGHFSDDNQKRLNGGNSDIPIYEAKMTRDTRLVYQVDCIPEFESDVERQVLKIYGVYTHAQIERERGFWNSASQQLSRKGHEYKRRCVFRNKPHHAGDKVFMPASFPAPELEVSPVTSHFPELPKEDLEQLHDLLVLDKFVTFSQALLNSIIAEQDVAHVFEVTPQEKLIIEHTRSCYVLGRSGTGKTTTMLFKMLGLERAWESHQDARPNKPRQIFVTQSRVLASKVEEYFAKLLESLETAGRTPKELARLVEKKNREREEAAMVDEDDEPEWRNDLPNHFSLLEDKHFPLFLTFDKLCKLLEADLDIKLTSLDGEIGDLVPSSPMMPITPHSARQHVPGRLVTYDVFYHSYWPHFSQSLTKGLDPSLVFSEFMGVIKGSADALERPERFLDKDSYEGLSHRAHSTFSSLRSRVYAIFLSYLKQKRERGDWDAADRTHGLLKTVQTTGLPGRRVDYLYVDEAQDNLLIDSYLLRLLCRNADGLFWAGDTAQTISIGSSFRFNDLKSFLFRLESQNSTTKAPDPPRTFQLAVNYRSHGGIVNTAHSVIDLITRFWPYSIDVLAQERGIVDGLKPVFFSGWDQDTVRYEQFLFGEMGSHVEFGAQQCILVRNEAARDKLRQEVGEIGIIMTLYEAKGLEFGDVLLYNFFEDSTVDFSQWRVVLNAITTEERSNLAAPQFDETRHAGVCSELKFLYVAITRARKNMWIVDCSEKSHPMRLFWSARNLVQNCTPGTDVPRLALSSTPQEWAAQGQTLFANKRYSQAMHCFERALLPREVGIANAYYLREKARAILTGRSTDSARQVAFLSAAKAFSQSAADATLKREVHVYYRNAGECFLEAGEKKRAADAYLLAGDYNQAAKIYRQINLFDEAVAVIKHHQSEMEPSTVDSIIGVSKLYYFREHQLQKAKDLFASVEEELDFLEEYDLDVAHAELLESLGRTKEAAELHFAEGRTMQAIRLLATEETLTGECVKYILQGLWKNISFGVSSEQAQDNVTVKELLDVAEQIQDSSIPGQALAVLKMFKAIVLKDTTALRILGGDFMLSGQHAEALLCLDHVFTSTPRIQVMEAPDVATQLDLFLQYALLLREFVLIPEPHNNPIVQQLFGIEPLTNSDFTIARDGFLFDNMDPSRQIISETELSLSTSTVNALYNRSLANRLRKRVQAENDMACKARVFSICLSFAMTGYCNRFDCPQEHVNSRDWSPSRYNLRVRLHLQQMLILQTLRSPIRYYPVDEFRFWISRFYHALNPPFHHLGTISHLETSLIPEWEGGIDCCNHWVLFLLRNLDPYKPRGGFLTSVIQDASLCLNFNRPNAGYMWSMNFLTVYRPPEYLRASGGRDSSYVIGDVVFSLQASSEFSLSTGILALKHIIDTKLPINVSVLCDFIDYTCGSAIINLRRDLHDVTLPRSWILSLMKQRTTSNQNAPLFLIVESLRSLMEDICSIQRADYLLYDDRKNLSNLTIAHRNVFMVRICRALGFLGYNFRNLGLRNVIVRALSSLRRPDRRFNQSLWGYVGARDWKDISTVVRVSNSDTSMDEMINLCHRARTFEYLPKGFRRVLFDNVSNIIPNVLDPTRAAASSNLRATAAPFNPKPKSLFVMAPEDEEALASETGMRTQTVEEDLQEEDLDLMDGSGPDLDHLQTEGAQDVAQAWDVAPPPTEEQVAAAQRIQAQFRRYRGQQKNALQLTHTTFIAFLHQSQKMNWPHSYYRLLFLGPLVSALVALAMLQNVAHGLKAKAKKYMTKASHNQLEEVMAVQTSAANALKDVIRLTKQLDVGSALHDRRDTTELKRLISEVNDLASRLPSGVTPEIWSHIELAVKGIVTDALPPKTKPEKPTLNVEDLAYDY